MADSSPTVVDRIIQDLQGRSGLDGMWGGIDEETQVEIRDAWVRIVEDARGPVEFAFEAGAPAPDAVIEAAERQGLHGLANELRARKSGALFSSSLLELQRAAGAMTPIKALESTRLLVWTEHRRDVDAHVGSLLVMGTPHDRIRVSTTLEPTDKPDVYRLATRVEVLP